jgi:DNA-binding Lrp family transcriptional regulator
MANMDIRLKAKGSGVPLWKLAESMGISEPTLTRRLRVELLEDEKNKLAKLIEELAVEVQS